MIHKNIQIDGCYIHYWVSEKDNAPWLVFLHGAGTDHRMFNAQLEALHDKYRILLWDARGHGLSRPMGKAFSIDLLLEDLCEILNIEGIEKAAFIGQSMGGNVVQEMVFHHPHKVESLVLIDCTCNTMKPANMRKPLEGIASVVLPACPWRYMVKYGIKVSSINADVQSYLRDAFNRVGKKDLVKILQATMSCHHYEDDYRINKPLLLVCGEKDNAGIKKMVSRLSSREPYCDFHMIRNAGHCANQDNPQEFNRLLVDFLHRQFADS